MKFLRFRHDFVVLQFFGRSFTHNSIPVELLDVARRKILERLDRIKLFHIVRTHEKRLQCVMFCVPSIAERKYFLVRTALYDLACIE